MRKSLFECAVLLHETNKKGEVTGTKIIIEPKSILGKSDKDVAFKITREIPEKHADNPDNVEIIIRNF